MEFWLVFLQSTGTLIKDSRVYEKLHLFAKES